MEEAQMYHRIMQLLRDSRKEHGTCQPRERRACTACNAAEEIDALLEEYRGAPVTLAGGD